MPWRSGGGADLVGHVVGVARVCAAFCFSYRDGRNTACGAPPECAERAWPRAPKRLPRRPRRVPGSRPFPMPDRSSASTGRGSGTPSRRGDRDGLDAAIGQQGVPPWSRSSSRLITRPIPRVTRRSKARWPSGIAAAPAECRDRAAGEGHRGGVREGSMPAAGRNRAPRPFRGRGRSATAAGRWSGRAGHRRSRRLVPGSARGGDIRAEEELVCQRASPTVPSNTARVADTKLQVTCSIRPIAPAASRARSAGRCGKVLVAVGDQ